MKRNFYAAFAALAFMAGSAMATDNHPPTTTPPGTVFNGGDTSASGGKALAGAAAGAIAGAAAGANAIGQGGAGGTGQGGTAGAAADGGAGGIGQGGKADASGGSVVVNNTTGSGGGGSRYRADAWAPVVHGEAAILPAAGLLAVQGKCGPRLRAITTQMTGVHRGFWGGLSEVPLGYTQEVGPYLNADGTMGDRFVQDKFTGELIGDQFTMVAGSLSVASSSSASLGLFNKGDAGQGGIAASGGMQQIGQHVIIVPCVYARLKEAIVFPNESRPVVTEPRARLRE